LLSVVFVILGACVLLFDFENFLFSFEIMSNVVSGSEASQTTNWGIIFVIAASFMWALDNNFTAKISIKNPIIIAATKGLTGGLVNLIFAFYLVGFNLDFKLILTGLALGFVSYGISIVLLIHSMRHLGASRAGILFGANPFMAAFLSIIILKEVLTYQFVFSAAIMAVGIIFIFSEKHRHHHRHDFLEHFHKHGHDAHHQHEHIIQDDSSLAHSHKHIHKQSEHSHEHLPDIHHKHKH